MVADIANTKNNCIVMRRVGSVCRKPVLICTVTAVRIGGLVNSMVN